MIRKNRYRRNTSNLFILQFFRDRTGLQATYLSRRYLYCSSNIGSEQRPLQVDFFHIRDLRLCYTG